MKRLGVLGILLFTLLATPFKGVAKGTYVPAASDSLYSDDYARFMEFRIFYPVNGIEVRENYMNNSLTLDKIKRYLSETSIIDSISIYSYASPEGPYRTNERLAIQRGQSAKQYIIDHVPAGCNFDPEIIRLMPNAENWKGLREEIVKDYHRKDRDQVLEIIDSNLPQEEKKNALSRLDRGRSWRYIKQNLMPRLRYATWISVKLHNPPSKFAKYEGPSIKVDMPRVPALRAIQRPAIVITPVDTTDTRTWLALKTNLLYDAISWLNFSIEAPLNEHFSLLYYHQFPWWRWGENKNEFCMRFLSIGAEGRWWFKPIPHEATESRIKRDRLTGWFAGVYLESGKWDFNRKRSICYQGEHWSTGLSIGYAMPIGKRLNLEFSLSAGYASIIHRGYEPSDDYSKLYHLPEKDGTWHYIGPTKAQVSLVLPLVFKQKKGGRP